MNTKEELHKIIENSFVSAQQTMSEMGGWQTTIEVYCKDVSGKNMRTMVVLADDKVLEKRFMISKGLGVVFGFLKLRDRILEVDSIIIISEAWMSRQGKNDVEEKGFIRASEDPKRIEALIVSGQTSDGYTTMKCKEMRSVVVKGKRFYSLYDVSLKDKDDKEEAPEKYESPLLSDFFLGFFLGYEKTLKQKENPLLLPFLPEEKTEELLPRLIGIMMKSVARLPVEN